MLAEAHNKKMARLDFLDGLRGWSALVVFFDHLLLGFLEPYAQVYRHPALHFALNGNLSVDIFFIISGFLLSSKFIYQPGVHSVSEAVVSRYFRLTIPIFVTSVITYLLLVSNLMFYEKAAKISGSGWLVFAAPKGEPTIGNLLVYSWYSNFMGNITLDYNSSLWTMTPEVFGSMLVYCMVAFFLPSGKRGRIMALPIFALWVYTFLNKLEMCCFVMGYVLAELYWSNLRSKQWVQVAATLLMPVAIYLACILPHVYDHNMLLAAVLMVFCVSFSPAMRWLFSTRPFSFLGRISFPLYLIQVSLFCSFSSYLLIQLAQTDYSRETIADIIIVSSLAVALFVSYVISPVENFSATQSKRIARKILSYTLQRSN